MSRTVKITIPVEIEVDLDEFDTTYGDSHTVDNVQRYIEESIADLVHQHLEYVDNGAALIGDLSARVGLI